MEYVKNGEIVLNISPEACQKFQMDHEWISFQARFGGVPKEIFVPVTHVMAIYARENGQGMSFPVQIPQENNEEGAQQSTGKDASDKPTSSRSHLKLVK